MKEWKLRSHHRSTTDQLMIEVVFQQLRLIRSLMGPSRRGWDSWIKHSLIITGVLIVGMGIGRLM